MARVVRRTWRADPGRGLTRRDRRGCVYEAYIPDRLRDRNFRLQGEVAADVADAEAAIRRLDTSALALADTEALASLLLRAESVASSYIEGLEVGGRRLLRAEAARALGAATGDTTAEEVLGNIDAMTWSISTLATAARVDIDGLLEVHRRLMIGTRLSGHAGTIREVQNWIGGSSYNPCSAAYVPPPHPDVADLLEDLCAFASDDSLPPVAQAAVAHAQFETIHPFIDGNGRVGRALIQVILRRRGIAERVLPPISLVLATWSKAYIEGLAATRYRGRADAAAAEEGHNLWIATFAGACSRSVEDAIAFEARIGNIEEGWHRTLGRVRSGSATALLLAALPGAPIITARGAADLVGRSFQATNEAIARLTEAGILSQITVGRRNRVFEARAIVDAFTDLERMLASPRGDTRASPPTRLSPHRR
jgi:Fic family protein